MLNSRLRKILVSSSIATLLYTSLILTNYYEAKLKAAVTIVNAGSRTSTSSATSSQVTVTGVTTGNYLIAVGASWSNPTDAITFTDDQSAGWNTDLQAGATPAGATAAWIGSKKAAQTATHVITASSTGSRFWEWGVIEVSGLATSSWLDKTGTKYEIATATSMVLTASGANAQADEFVVVAMACGSADTDAHITTPSGYTSFTGSPNAFYNPNCNASVGLRAAYKSVSGVETSAATFGFDAISAGESNDGALVTYKIAAVAGTRCCGGLMKGWPVQ